MNTLNTIDFITGIVLGPLFWSIVLYVGYKILLWRKQVNLWFYGTNLIQKFALFLVMTGVRYLRPTHIRIKESEGYWWFSPKSERYRVQ